MNYLDELESGTHNVSRIQPGIAPQEIMKHDDHL